MLQIARALAALHSHAKKITHRDIKPGNVFLSQSGDWILGDPGVAHRDDCGDETQTRPVSKDWAPRWYDDPYAQSLKTDLYLLGATGISVLVGGDKPLDASYLTKPKFDLPKLFPNAPGIERLYALIRELVVVEPDHLPYKDAAELIPVLEALLPAVENDTGWRVREEVEQLRAMPRLVFSFASSATNALSGDRDSLTRVPIWIPDDCERLVFWPRGHQKHICGVRLYDLGYHQLQGEIVSMPDDVPTVIKVPPGLRGLSARMTVTGNSGELLGLLVYAERGPISMAGNPA
jgi:serine/threonine protein kinase